jgi:hypothetical protein
MVMVVVYVIVDIYKVLLGMTINNVVYAHPNTLIEAMACVNIICGVVIDNVIMARIV